MATNQDPSGRQLQTGGSPERPHADDLADELLVQRISRWLVDVAIKVDAEAVDD